MSEEDLKLIEEMKDNCIKQANYVDVKAMDKYNALRNLLEQNKKYKEVIDKFINRIDENKMLLNNPYVLDFYLEIKEVE